MLEKQTPPLVKREATGRDFRVIRVGITGLSPTQTAYETETPDASTAARAKAELAVDKIRDKFGRAAVGRGISFGNDD